MTTPTWEERDLAIHQLFMARLQQLMDDSGVSQGELARRMGGGVTQGNVSRWLSCKGTKMTPGRFGTAVRALGQDPAKQFASVVADARDAGLMEPGAAIARKKQVRAVGGLDELEARRRGPMSDDDAEGHAIAASDERPEETGPDGEDAATEELDGP